LKVDPHKNRFVAKYYNDKEGKSITSPFLPQIEEILPYVFPVIGSGNLSEVLSSS
jgi:hypothetical protein